MRHRERAGQQPPIADFDGVVVSVAPRTLQFTDRSTDVDGGVVAWSWSFGDGITVPSAIRSTPAAMRFSATGRRGRHLPHPEELLGEVIGAPPGVGLT
jgi:hypothetical protein